MKVKELEEYLKILHDDADIVIDMGLHPDVGEIGQYRLLEPNEDLVILKLPELCEDGETPMWDYESNDYVREECLVVRLREVDP